VAQTVSISRQISDLLVITFNPNLHHPPVDRHMAAIQMLVILEVKSINAFCAPFWMN